MKAFSMAILVLALALALGPVAQAYENYEVDFNDVNRFDRNLMWWKLGRGFTNLISLPHEVLTNMGNEAIKGQYVGAYDGGLQGSLAGAANGYIAGFFKGMYYGVKRMTTGALEIVTFWKPEYGPTMDPQWGTRALTMGEQDYFDPDPFWYTGPSR